MGTREEGKGEDESERERKERVRKGWNTRGFMREGEWGKWKKREKEDEGQTVEGEKESVIFCSLVCLAAALIVQCYKGNESVLGNMRILLQGSICPRRKASSAFRITTSLIKQQAERKK